MTTCTECYVFSVWVQIQVNVSNVHCGSADYHAVHDQPGFNQGALVAIGNSISTSSSFLGSSIICGLRSEASVSIVVQV
jgi:hypothetical protein